MKYWSEIFSTDRASAVKNRGPTFHSIDRTSEVNKLFIIWLINPSCRIKNHFHLLGTSLSTTKSLGNVLNVIHFILTFLTIFVRFLLSVKLDGKSANKANYSKVFC